MAHYQRALQERPHRVVHQVAVPAGVLGDAHRGEDRENLDLQRVLYLGGYRHEHAGGGREVARPFLAQGSLAMACQRLFAIFAFALKHQGQGEVVPGLLDNQIRMRTHQLHVLTPHP